jgi:NADH dehydrogenase
LDRAGRLLVEADCTIPDNPYIFVIGDAAACKAKSGFLPGLAPVAAQQGKYVAKIITNKIEKDKRTPFKYLDKGIMATIGKKKAVMEYGGFRMTGFFAWIAWSVVHLLFLVLFRNKISILLSWIYNYFTEQRGARLIK